MKKTVALCLALVLVFIFIPQMPALADTAGPLDHLVITPSSVSIPAGTTQQFTASAQDSANVTVTDAQFTWTILTGSGSINDSGLFTASFDSGDCTIQVTAVKDGITVAATAVITVLAGQDGDDGIPPESDHGNKKDTPPGWSQGNKTGWGGASLPPGRNKNPIG